MSSPVGCGRTGCRGFCYIKQSSINVQNINVQSSAVNTADKVGLVIYGPLKCECCGVQYTGDGKTLLTCTATCTGNYDPESVKIVVVD